MKVAPLGATGFVGTALLKEALNRRHIVTAIGCNDRRTGTSRACPAALYGRVLKARNYEGCVASGQHPSHNSNLF